MNEKFYYLMVKTHNHTGLKYLCFHHGTDTSCFTYKGSGKYWLNHLRKHGNQIHTEILEKSEKQEVISEKGLEFSKLWNVVDSKEFANLMPEDAKTTAGKLLEPWVREKALATKRKRYREIGLTEKEKEVRVKGVSAMHSPENRKKAQKSIRDRYESGNLTEKQLQKGDNMKKRILTQGFTEKELSRGFRVSSRQQGKSMQERLGDPNWIDPRKGKSAKEIYGEDYIHPNKGKKFEGISESSKPFKFIVNGNISEIYANESDFESRTKMSALMLSKIKKKDDHIIKRQSNTKHSFKTGDVVKVVPMTIDEYKQLIL
jgi:hypothetical protein